jgi:hypothetical protein
MTIKVGTRVRVSYEATVRQIVGGGTYYVPPEEKLPGEASAWWLHPSRFEVIAQPLQVGDVITADSPEPPDGTTIMDQSGECARRDGDLWRVTWGARRTWEEFARVHLGSRHITWTVQHVGDGAS